MIEKFVKLTSLNGITKNRHWQFKEIKTEVFHGGKIAIRICKHDENEKLGNLLKKKF